MPHSVEMKCQIVYSCIGGLWKQSSSSERQQCKWNLWNGLYVVGYHSIMRKQAYLANGKRDMSWCSRICLYNGLLFKNKKSLIVVTPKFKDKFEYSNLMCAPGIVAHTSQQITNVSSQVSYITIITTKDIKVCDKQK